MRVFKFGGASVNSAPAVRNMAAIVGRYCDDALVVVVSAMGKTTNLLEQLVPGVNTLDEHPALLQQTKDYHMGIVRQLFTDAAHPVYADLERLFSQLQRQSSLPPTTYNYDYSQTVCFG